MRNTILGNYLAEEGSLILTFYPQYLETLSVGEHTLAIRFRDSDLVTTTLTIKETAAAGFILLLMLLGIKVRWYGSKR